VSRVVDGQAEGHPATHRVADHVGGSKVVAVYDSGHRIDGVFESEGVGIVDDGAVPVARQVDDGYPPSPGQRAYQGPHGGRGAGEAVERQHRMAGARFVIWPVELDVEPAGVGAH